MSEFFDELMESVNQAIAIHKGEIPPSRVFHIERPDVKIIREKTGLSQIQLPINCILAHAPYKIGNKDDVIQLDQRLH